MNIPELIKELEAIEQEQAGYIAGEKLSGNVVKEALYQGTSIGLRIAIAVIQERLQAKDDATKESS